MINWFKNNKKIAFTLLLFAIIGLAIPTPTYAGFFSWFASKTADWTLGLVARGVGYAVYVGADWLFRLASYVWEYMIPFSLGLQPTDSFNPYGLKAMVDGWALMRDLANMGFIFMILYLAIQTILGIEGGNVGRKLVTIIVAALLINFSLAISEAVIDASNILAGQFWSSISRGDSTSEIFVDALNLKTLGNSAAIEALPSNTEVAMLYLGGAVFLTISAFVLMAGGFMFLMRSFTLVILIILSPVAFAAYAIGNKKGEEWLNRLLNEAFFAPIYLIMIWVSVMIISSDGFATFKGKGTFAGLLVSSEKSQISGMSIIFSFGIVIFLLTAAITIAKSMSATSANFGTSMAGKVFGAAAGTAGFAGRQTIGRVAKIASQSDVGRAPGSSRLAQMTRTALDSQLGRRAVSAAATGSFDVRGAPGAGTIQGGLERATGINIGQAGGQGGFQREGGIRAMARRVYPPIPAAGTELEQAARAQARTERAEERARALTPDAIRATLTAPTPAGGTSPGQGLVRSLNSQELSTIPPDMFTNINFVRHLTASQLGSLQRGTLSGEQMKAIGNLIRGNAGIMDPSAHAHVTSGPSANLWS